MIKAIIASLFFILTFSALSGAFTEVTVSLPNFVHGSAAWGDYDNDGFLDLIIAGTIGTTDATRIYKNNGNGTFTDINANLVNVGYSRVKWGDCNNDGYLDILLMGWAPYVSYSIVYINNQDGSFTEIGSDILGLSQGDCAWGDFDNDGALDVLISGDGLDFSMQNFYTKIYHNNRNNTFSDIDAGFLGAHKSSVAWADYDLDGDLDFFMTGRPTYTTSASKLYRNNGNGAFSDINTFIIPLGVGSMDWGNFDNDLDPDLIVAGYNSDNSTYNARVYRNNGTGTFSEVIANVPGVTDGSSNWCDFDNDGDLDFFITGNAGSPLGLLSRLYRNNGNSSFTLYNWNVTGVWFSYSAWCDYDNDGDLDVIMGGYNGSVDICKLYRNDTTAVNSPPSAPTGLYQYQDGDYTVFTWNPPADDHTDANHLTYNLRIGTTPGGCEIMSPMASPEGFRRIAAMGYANANCSWKIKTSALPAVQHYYWSVQAIDTAFQGSPFASEIEVDPTGITNPVAEQVPLNISAGPNPFHHNTNLIFSLKGSTYVSIEIFNVKGQHIKTIYAGYCPQGKNQQSWNGYDHFGKLASPGLYFVKIAAEGKSVYQKIIMLH